KSRIFSAIGRSAGSSVASGSGAAVCSLATVGADADTGAAASFGAAAGSLVCAVAALGAAGAAFGGAAAAPAGGAASLGAAPGAAAAAGGAADAGSCAIPPIGAARIRASAVLAKKYRGPLIRTLSQFRRTLVRCEAPHSHPVALSSFGFARRTNSLPTNLVNFGPLSPHCFVRSGVFVKECHRITTKPPSYWGVLALHPSEAGLR